MTRRNTDFNPVFPFSIVSFADYVEELGHPYMWVQTLGGLHFPNDTSEVGLGCPILSQKSLCVFQPYYANIFFPPQGVRGGSSLSASQMESTMKLLKGRVQSRLALTKQFASLGMLDVIVHNA